jgi:FKBP-type peptidyl-prolyl cis-trans isomerase FkpA
MIFAPYTTIMTKSFLAPFIFSMILSSLGCSKNKTCESMPPDVIVPAVEITAVEDYLSSKTITDAVKSDAGFYYKILEPGTGNVPTLCSSVSIFYTGKLTNETVFDGTSSTPATFTLNQLISGWQLGVPLIKKGGRLVLYLPPSLAYGSRASGPIPANSVLIFEITLVDFQ